MESIIETEAITLVQFLQGLGGELHATLEEGTWAAWLYDGLTPRVHEVVVCNPRRNALLSLLPRIHIVANRLARRSEFWNRLSAVTGVHP